MVEVEIKVRMKKKEKLQNELEKFGFLKGNLLRETDFYFDNETGDFRKGDKALRIRQCENLTQGESISYMTYKGPKLDQVSMTRKELEMQIENAGKGTELLKSLGYHPV